MASETITRNDLAAILDEVLPSTQKSIAYTTTLPTASNTDGLKVVLCSSEPATKYSGWIYLIEES